MVTQFHSPPIHLDEIKLTMEFQVKIADVALGGNVFFEMGLLSAKIRLCEEKAPTAAARSIGLTFKTLTLC